MNFKQNKVFFLDFFWKMCGCGCGWACSKRTGLLVRALHTTKMCAMWLRLRPKGQIMSECIYEIINFPKYHRRGIETRSSRIAHFSCSSRTAHFSRSSRPSFLLVENLGLESFDLVLPYFLVFSIELEFYNKYLWVESIQSNGFHNVAYLFHSCTVESYLEVLKKKQCPAWNIEKQKITKCIFRLVSADNLLT